MSRVLFFVALAASVLTASAVRARVDVAPAPREIRADGSRDPVPLATPAKKENPFEVVERIIKNSNAVGDKLAKTDTGTETRAKQDTILKDIQSLIDQQEDPPPPKPDQNQDQDKNKDQEKDKNDKDQEKKPNDKNDKKSDMMPMGNMGEMPPMKNDMGGMGGMGGDQPKGRNPRRQNGEPKEKDSQPMKSSGMAEPKPMTGTAQKDPKNPGGARPDPLGGPPDAPRMSIPFEDEIAKDVWGHLPDKLRQQATQYYKQEFMPRYAELLKHYYSSLSEKGGKK
jgi:hypothetical protein